MIHARSCVLTTTVCMQDGYEVDEFTLHAFEYEANVLSAAM
jgi:hypothetical protein